MENLHPPCALTFDGNIHKKWQSWKRAFHYFLTAIEAEKKEEKIKTAILLTCIGEEGRMIYEDFQFDNTQDKYSLRVVLGKYDSYCQPTPTITTMRHKFFTYRQTHGQTFISFLTELERLSAECDFGSMKDSLVKDMIVCGVQDDEVRDRLLYQDDLDLRGAIKIVQSVQTKQNQKNAIKQISQSIPVNLNELSTYKGKDDGVNIRPRTVYDGDNITSRTGYGGDKIRPRTVYNGDSIRPRTGYDGDNNRPRTVYDGDNRMIYNGDNRNNSNKRYNKVRRSNSKRDSERKLFAQRYKSTSELNTTNQLSAFESRDKISDEFCNNCNTKGHTSNDCPKPLTKIIKDSSSEEEFYITSIKITKEDGSQVVYDKIAAAKFSLIENNESGSTSSSISLPSRDDRRVKSLTKLL